MYRVIEEIMEESNKGMMKLAISANKHLSQSQSNEKFERPQNCSRDLDHLPDVNRHKIYQG